MTNEELIKKIAKASRNIVVEADAQGVTTGDEVEAIVFDLLTDKSSLESIKRDAKAEAEELCSKKISEAPALEQLADYGADYGPLYRVLDGYSTVKEAVRQGLVDNWAHVMAM